MEQSIKLASTIENLSIVESMVEEISSKKIINEDKLGNVMVCVTEAVTNAIEHGNKNQKNKTVFINYKTINNKLIFKVTDQGNGFDYENIPDPTLPENIEKENGRGVFLIKNLADNVKFEKNGSEIIFEFEL
jgi:serine/threonine-protein kinase RsbW